MESINPSAFFSIVMGRNCFCCLCFKTVADSAVHMQDEIFIKLKDGNINIVVADMLIEVLGEKLYNELASFDAICNLCLSSLLNSLKFIRNSKNNIQRLCKIIDNFSMGIKDATRGVTNENRAVYVAIDTKRCKWNKYYSKVSFQCRPNAYRKFKYLADQFKFEESKKRANLNKKVLKVNLVRLEQNNIVKPNKYKNIKRRILVKKLMEASKQRNYGNINNKPVETTQKVSNGYNSPVITIERVSNQNNTIANLLTASNNNTVAKISERSNEKNAVVNLSRRSNNKNTVVNLSRSSIDINNTKSVAAGRYILVSDINDKANKICRLITRPNILKPRCNKNKKQISEVNDKGISKLNETIHKPLLTTLSEKLQSTSKELTQISQLKNNNSLQLQTITSYETEQLNGYDEDTLQCQYCGMLCINSPDLMAHLKTHDMLLIMETIIK